MVCWQWRVNLSYSDSISLLATPLPSFSVLGKCLHLVSHSFKWELWFSLRMFVVAAAAESLQSHPTLCDPRDGSPPGSPVPGILQARTLESVAISFSNAWKWKVKVKALSRVRLPATPWTVAYQAPPSMGFSRQEYWSGMPLSSPKDTFLELSYKSWSKKENSINKNYKVIWDLT